MDTLHKKKISTLLRTGKNGLQCVINGVHVYEIITILVMVGKKRTIVISKNKCHVCYFASLKDSPLVDATYKRSPNHKEMTIMHHCQQQPKE